jgi:ArsR family transcriptional regulator, arsenate/arsenite/antimonite-responsive transcriptional repressor
MQTMEASLAIMAALANPIRLRCMALLATVEELCVCQLVHALQAPQPKISRHLSVLQEAGLVTQRRTAQWTLYRAANLPDWASTLLRGAVLGLCEAPLPRRDRARLASAPEGPSPIQPCRVVRRTPDRQASPTQRRRAT